MKPKAPPDPPLWRNMVLGPTRSTHPSTYRERPGPKRGSMLFHMRRILDYVYKDGPWPDGVLDFEEETFDVCGPSGEWLCGEDNTNTDADRHAAMQRIDQLYALMGYDVDPYEIVVEL